MSVLGWIKNRIQPSREGDEVCAYCGTAGHFGRYNQAGPVCDACFRKIAMSTLIDAASEISERTNKTSSFCDGCGNPTLRETGYTLSTADLVLSPAYWESAIKRRVDLKDEDEFAAFVAVQAGSATPWFLCVECSEGLKFDRKLARNISMSPNPQPPGLGKVEEGDATLVAAAAYAKHFGRWPTNLPLGRGLPEGDELHEIISKIYSDEWRSVVSDKYGNHA